MKKGLWILAACVAVPVAFLQFFDLNTYRQDIEAALSARAGQEIRVGGDIKIGLESLRPSVVLHDISMGDMRAEKVEVARGLKNFHAAVSGFHYQGRSFGHASSPVGADGDGFSLPALRGRIGGGEVTGSVSLRGGRLEINLKGRGVDYALLSPVVEGGDMRIDTALHARGGDMISTLSGDFTLAGGRGKMSGRTLDLWAADLLSSVFAKKGEETEINCSSAVFSVENGVASTRNLVVDTENVTVLGKGRIDFARGYVDMKLMPRPKSRAVLNLAAPVRVHGPFGSLRVTPDSRKVAEKIGGLALGIVNPAAALVPYMMQKTADKNPCAAAAGTEKTE